MKGRLLAFGGIVWGGAVSGSMTTDHGEPTLNWV